MKKISLIICVLSIFLFSCNQSLTKNEASLSFYLPITSTRAGVYNHDFTSNNVNFFEVDLLLNENLISQKNGNKGEKIEFQNLKPGLYKILVKGYIDSLTNKHLYAYGITTVELEKDDNKIVPIVLELAKISQKKLEAGKLEFMVSKFIDEYTIGDTINHESFEVKAKFFNQDNEDFIYTLTNNFDYLISEGSVTSSTSPLSIDLNEKIHFSYNIKTIPLTINVCEPIITNQSQTQYVPLDDSNNLNLSVTLKDCDDNISSSYQWYESSDGNNFYIIENATSDTYSPEEVTSNTRKYFYCEITNTLKSIAEGNSIGIKEKSVKSEIITIHYIENPVTPSISITYPNFPESNLGSLTSNPATNTINKDDSESVTITFNLNDTYNSETDEIVYNWYIDGVLQESNTSSITIDLREYKPGLYNIAVQVINKTKSIYDLQSIDINVVGSTNINIGS